MRILIIEDEIKIRHGLANLITRLTEHEIIAEAKNGQEGLEWILKTQPDLVITDIKMPVMSGLEMIQRLHEMGRMVHCVILSGYSEFDYAKQAIRYGVDDYLLKPLAPEDIMKLLRSVEEKLQQEAKHKSNAAQRVLWEILESSTKEDEYQSMQEELGFRSGEEYVLLAGYGWDTFFEERRELHAKMEDMKKRFQCRDMHCLILEEKKELVCLLPLREKKRFLEEMKWSFIKNQKKWIWSEADVRSFSEIREAYKAAREFYLYNMLAGQDIIFLTKEICAAYSWEAFEYPEELESKIKASIYNQNAEQTKKQIQIFKEYMEKRRYEPKKIKAAYSKMIQHMLIALENSEKHIYEQIEPMGYSNKLRACFTRKEMNRLLDELCEMIDSYTGQKEDISNYAIKRAISYIRIHYKENIMLEELANKLDITPEYLSTLFNREVGVNFSSFLKEFRISHAKRLLKSTDKKVYEIAEEVGYPDSKYFNRVFKEKVGVSPREFRLL